ncbi:MAG TPA: prepilin-type N-terminal cleavage/methylation domain-containing protein [Candidatus Saccharimonadales bacterium]|nr:prepilin-type N-terminal cleavage/methylation domain-containing protein [Candidatus Saccharimonadales bacterium]
MLKKLRANQSGDTIVEVMIVLAVLGLAIGISYATANRSLLNARQAQENSQASAAAQSQVEQLVSIGCTSKNPTCATNNLLDNYLAAHSPTSSFCIVAGQPKDSTDSACPAQAALPGASVAIKCIASCTAPVSPARTFEVTVSWDDVLGQGRDTVTQDYTIPQ